MSTLKRLVDRLAGRVIAVGQPYFNARFDRLERITQEEARFAMGVQIEESRRANPVINLQEAGYRVYSQFDQDGILQAIFRRLPNAPKLFVEFGVQDYRESSTRYPLEKDFWRGVIVDPAPDASEFLKASGLLGSHDIEHIQSFVTAENINRLFGQLPGDPGLMIIDVDGVDYYLWQALSVVKPWVIGIEYQSLFGPSLDLGIPYSPDFDRTKCHSSNLAYGASLTAIVRLAKSKGYQLIAGSNVHHDVFFVRDDLAGAFPIRSIAEVFTDVQHRESRDPAGRSTFLRERKQQRLTIADVVVHDFLLNVDRPFRSYLSETGDLFDERRWETNSIG